jgi:hypothetical protein
MLVREALFPPLSEVPQGGASLERYPRKEACLLIPDNETNARLDAEAERPGEPRRLRVSRQHLRLTPSRLVFLEAPERPVADERDEPA